MPQQGRNLDDLVVQIKANPEPLKRGLLVATVAIKGASKVWVQGFSLTQTVVEKLEGSLRFLNKRILRGFLLAAGAVATLTASVTALGVQSARILKETDRDVLAFSASIGKSVGEAAEVYGTFTSKVRSQTGSSLKSTLAAFEKAISAGFRDPVVASQLALGGLVAEMAGLAPSASALIRTSTTLASSMYGLEASATDARRAMELCLLYTSPSPRDS